MAVFNEDIKEWRRKPEAEKTWTLFKTHFQRAHKEQHNATTTAGQGGYSATVNSIYGMPTNEEQAAQQDLQERAAESLETISDGLSTHQDIISELTQANAVLSSSNTTLAAQMAQMMQQMQTLQLLVSQSHGHAPAVAPPAAPSAGGGRHHSHTTIAGAMESANIQGRPAQSGKKDTRKKLPKPTNWEGARTACETRKDLE
eukprot:scaffold11617_cov53-Attheya_sp.AAC.5